MTRDQLLDAISGQGSDRSDRNVDFLINRLRRKLGDDARSPRYIATRYGEGYVWIGASAGNLDRIGEAYLVIGPIRGLDNLGEHRALAERFVTEFHEAAATSLPPDQPVELAPDCPPPSAFDGPMPRVSISLAFFDEAASANCVVTARDFRSGRILVARRIVVEDTDPPARIRHAREIAQVLIDDSWRALATQAENAVPLPVAMYTASSPRFLSERVAGDSDRQLLKAAQKYERRTFQAWKETRARLINLRRADPDDPVLKIMYATHIHSKYVSNGHLMSLADFDHRREDEDEIERLVLEALPQVQSRSEYAIMAGKLLHFLDRGYFELAREIAETAYRSSLSAASSLAIIGQLRAFAGETVAALRCIDQSLNLVEPGSKAHQYTLVIKCQALMAAGDYGRLQEAKRELYAMAPAAVFFFEPLYSHPNKLSFRARLVTMLLSREKAAATLLNLHYISARLFRDREQGANTIRTPVKLFAGRFGREIIAQEILDAFPDLLPMP